MAYSVFFTGTKSINEVQYKEVNLQQPKEKEVRINVKYAGLNFSDLMKKLGTFSNIPKTPFVPGTEASGIIEEVGKDVDEFKVGDRVLAVNHIGCFTTSLTINIQNVFKLPDNVELDKAASIFLNYVTAYHMLFDMGNLKSDQVILMPQSSGGVGHAVIQLASTIPNVDVIGLCSTTKVEYMKSLGIKHVIDYKTQNYEDEVKKLYPNGIDLIFDSLNGTDSVKCFNLLKPFGKIIHYGAANFAQSSFLNNIRKSFQTLSMNSLKMINTNRFMGGYFLNDLITNHFDIVRNTLTLLIKMLSDGKINPKIDSVFSLESTTDAMIKMMEGKSIGKILLSTETSNDEDSKI